jgi:hypothetical protein
MASVIDPKPRELLKKSLFTADVGIQTESIMIEAVPASTVAPSRVDIHEDQESTLSAEDLASILKWSKDISSDINLSSGRFSL